MFFFFVVCRNRWENKKILAFTMKVGYNSNKVVESGEKWFKVEYREYIALREGGSQC